MRVLISPRLDSAAKSFSSSASHCTALLLRPSARLWYLRSASSLSAAADEIWAALAAQPQPDDGRRQQAVCVLSEPYYSAYETLCPWSAPFRLLRDLHSLRAALRQPPPTVGLPGTGSAAGALQLLPPQLRVVPAKAFVFAQLAAAPRLWASRRAVGDVHGVSRRLTEI